MSRRREYRVSWQRVDGPRHSKRFPTKGRAESYLAAVRAMSPEERYGDKADKPWHCSGSSGDGYSEPYEPCYKNCEGKTWREHWNERFMVDGMELKPLSWSKLDSRPLPDWEDGDAEPVIEFKFGDVIERQVWLTVKGSRLMRAIVIDDSHALRIGDQDVFLYGKHYWVRVDE